VLTRVRLVLIFIVVTAAAFLSTGTFAARYLFQAARGQYSLLRTARPLAEATQDPATPAATRRLLSAVGAIKAYAEEQGLQPTGSYGRYADLHRPAAAWIVQACAPLSFEVKRWRFPLVGSVPYLGFFDESAAKDYAATLAREGALDVDVRPARAFSTLGWFSDPILSTMLRTGDDAMGALANVVLHESVHATVYVKDQSAFDESLASFVADRLTGRWLAIAFGADAPETKAWIEAHGRDRAFVERMHRTYGELEALYQSSRSVPAKIAEKARVLAAVAEELRLARPPNNASLAGYWTYGSGEAAFGRLFTACGENWPRVLQATATLSAGDFSRPQLGEFDAVVDRLAQRCEGKAGTRVVASSP
jgi:predicted aminopeptidase